VSARGEIVSKDLHMRIYKEKLEELNDQASKMFEKMNKINNIILKTTVDVEMSVVDTENKFQKEITGLLEKN
jgi:uncharacterized protein YydD (DUF2326 family)